MRFCALIVAVALGSASCEERQAASPASSPSAPARPAAAGPVVVLTDATFEAEVLKSDMPVLVDFWASWCAPCKIIAPTVEELAGEYKGRVKVGKVDTDANSTFARKYNINAIPALLVFHKGEVKHKFIGVTSKQELAKALDSTL